MKRFLPLLLVCACAGSLVDHDGASSTSQPPTQSCIDTCQPPASGTQHCSGNVCGFDCNAGLLKVTAPPSCSVPTAVAAGGNHTCAIAAGAVLCWGDNSVRQLGFDAPTPMPTPTQVPGLPAGADEIAASTTQTCAHFANAGIGEVWCWGGPDGIDAASRAPHKIDGITGNNTVNAIAAGAAHACAATDTGVFCWGHNRLGQLGSPPDDPAQPDVVHPTVQVNNVPAAKVLAAGDNHTCAGDTTGSLLYCWGDNSTGQDGTGGITGSSLPAVVQRAGASIVAAGANHTCSIGGGTLSCWGANLNFQVDNSKIDRTQPRGESVSQPVTGVAGGVGHTCAVESAGASVSCWGLNDEGQLGLGTADLADFSDRQNPTRMPSLTDLRSIAAGSKHTCALTKASTLLCWGANDSGQLGTGKVSGGTSTPQPVTGL